MADQQLLDTLSAAAQMQPAAAVAAAAAAAAAAAQQQQQQQQQSQLLLMKPQQHHRHLQQQQQQQATGMCDEKTVEYLRDLIQEKQTIEATAAAGGGTIGEDGKANKSVVVKLLEQGKIDFML